MIWCPVTMNCCNFDCDLGYDGQIRTDSIYEYKSSLRKLIRVIRRVPRLAASSRSIQRQLKSKTPNQWTHPPRLTLMLLSLSLEEKSRKRHGIVVISVPSCKWTTSTTVLWPKIVSITNCEKGSLGVRNCWPLRTCCIDDLFDQHLLNSTRGNDLQYRNNHDEQRRHQGSPLLQIHRQISRRSFQNTYFQMSYSDNVVSLSINSRRNTRTKHNAHSSFWRTLAILKESHRCRLQVDTHQSATVYIQKNRTKKVSKRKNTISSRNQTCTAQIKSIVC